MSFALDGVSQGYGRSLIIKEINTTFWPGITALLGPNGAGKTTLLRTLATIMPPRTGTTYLDGLAIDDERSARRMRDRIGYLPQHFGFDPNMAVADFVAYAAWLRGVPAREQRRSVDDALEMVDLVDNRRTKMRKLSGGMRQRAGIAWTIVGRPRLVLLDEPTAGIDPRQRLQFRKILTDLDDTIVVLSTHLIDDVAALRDRVIVIHDGVAKFDGAVEALEALGHGDAPGHTKLERAYMQMLPIEEQQL